MKQKTFTSPIKLYSKSSFYSDVLTCDYTAGSANRDVEGLRYRKAASLTKMSDALMIVSDDSGLELCKIDSFGRGRTLLDSFCLFGGNG